MFFTCKRIGANNRLDGKRKGVAVVLCDLNSVQWAHRINIACYYFDSLLVYLETRLALFPAVAGSTSKIEYANLLFTHFAEALDWPCSDSLVIVKDNRHPVLQFDKQTVALDTV